MQSACLVHSGECELGGCELQALVECESELLTGARVADELCGGTHRLSAFDASETDDGLRGLRGAHREVECGDQVVEDGHGQHRCRFVVDACDLHGQRVKHGRENGIGPRLRSVACVNGEIELASEVCRDL